MNSFVWKGKAPDGTFRSERVLAENAQEAKAILVAQGWSDLQLVMDEICDLAARQCVNVPEDIEQETQNQLTTDDEVKYFEGKAPGFLARYKKVLLEDKGILLVLLCWTGWSIYSGRKWSLIIGATSLGFMVLLFPAISAFFSLGSQYYARLNKAKVWSRWEEVLRCVERLRQVRRLTRIGPGEFELVRCRAQALAALGQLDKGLEEFSRFGDDPAVPRWQYFSMLSTIYDCAKEFEKAQECRRNALVEKSDTSLVWIDVAYGLVRGLNRPAEAREALAQAEALEISELGIPYLSFLRGIICWREAKFAEAQQHFEKALSGFRQFAHSPLIEGLLLLTKSYLCAVYGAQGDLAVARKYFGQVEKFLQAARDDELLDACRRPLASPHGRL